GATFDPCPFYRAAAALEVQDHFGLDVAELRRVSLLQTERLLAAASAARLPIASPTAEAERGGFIAIAAADADRVVSALRARSVLVDARRGRVRLGPAPYLTDAELDRGVDELA